MPNYRHQVRLPYASGLPEDVAINVFHSISDDDAEAVAFASALVTFYGAIDGLLSNQLSAAADACSVITYDLSDPEPRIPVATDTFTLTTNASTIPLEIALCLSFQAAPISGLPQARRRGRVFLGPLGGIQDSTNARPQAAHITTIVNAADALLTASNGPGVGVWAVFSPTNDQTAPVNNGWVDNEFDTIRGRGRKPTSRTLFAL